MNSNHELLTMHVTIHPREKKKRQGNGKKDTLLLILNFLSQYPLHTNRAEPITSFNYDPQCIIIELQKYT